MLRSFFKDSIIYGGANLLSKCVVVLLVPMYARVFSPDEMGAVDMIAALGAVASVIVPLGIGNGVARFLPDANNVDSRLACASSAWWFTAGAYVLFATIALIFSDEWTVILLDSKRWTSTFRTAILSIVFTGLQYYLQGLLRWRLRPKQFIISNVFSMLVMGCCTVLFVLAAHAGVEGIYYAQILGALVGSVIAWTYNRDILGRTLDKEVLRRLLVFSLPIVPALAGEFITNYIDRIAIKKLMTIGDVGIYGMGYRFASVSGLLMAGFSSAITPLVYAHYRDEQTPAEISRIFRYFLTAAIPFVCGMALFSQEMLWLFATPAYYSAAPLIPVLSVSFLLLGMYNFAPGLSIAMRTRSIALIHILTAVTNTGLNILLIPLFGIAGAAVATLVSAIMTFYLYMLLSQRCYRIPHQWSRIFISLAIGLFFVLVGMSAKSNATPSVTGLVVKTLLLMASTLLVSIVLIGRIEIRRTLRRYGFSL